MIQKSKEEILEILLNYDTDSEEFGDLEEEAEKNALLKQLIDETLNEIKSKIPVISKEEYEILRMKKISKPSPIKKIITNNFFKMAAAILLITNIYFIHVIYKGEDHRHAQALGYSEEALKNSLDTLEYSIFTFEIKELPEIDKLEEIVLKIKDELAKKQFGNFVKYKEEIERILLNCKNEDLKKIIQNSDILTTLERKN